MNYQELVNVYIKLDSTTKRLEKTEIISDFLKTIDDDSIYDICLLILGGVFPAWSDKELGIGDKLLIQAIAKVVGVNKTKVEEQINADGDLGIACEKLFLNKKQTTFFAKSLTIDFVFTSLQRLSDISGNNSTNKKISIITELLSLASASEAKYISRTIIEELRIGVGEGIVRDAISQAFNIDKKVTERAHMLTNDLGLVASVAQRQGEVGLKKLTLTPGKPVKPMLAQLSPGIKESIKEMGEALCETKYDGIRLQIHRVNDKILIFTRRLENITLAMPEIVKLIDENLPHFDFIVEGEVIATKNGKPISFQNILRRVKRKYNIEEAIENVPLKVFLFDVLFYKKPMIDEPLIERRRTLEEIVDTSKDEINLSDMIICTCENANDAEALFKKSIDENHEGIMIKDASEPYIPGLRGKKMLKFKAEPETLDLVVVGGVRGLGKRGDFIGSYLVALRDENDNLKTVAHVATGLDDETLEYLTGKMKEYELSQKDNRIFVQPKIVLEIAFSEIVKSPEYEAGYSLRFPVVKGIRSDKGLEDIDTIERLKSMYKE
ncbi:ATP-dependent DNA ligase [Methanobrevibacter sp. DSM 116169]|uniref:ATP-dependent DNA ligase n=1 Tax=Methanobrevibacter sp. DSM 116169 TaxID=3242727 RepID=UPI0038FCD1EB